MRTKSAALVMALLVLALLVPSSAWARRETIIGSLTLTKAGGAALTTELVGLAIISNPGFEKNVGQQLPPFTIPVVLDSEREDGDDAASPTRHRRWLVHTDTLLVLTNTTGDPLGFELTVRDALGHALLDKASMTLDAHATMVIQLSTLLP